MRPAQPQQWRPRVRWVATPPPGVGPRRVRRAPERYTGPPAYPVPPRWGFPNLIWRLPTTVPGTPSSRPAPLQRLRPLAHASQVLLWMVFGLALIAAGGELWRYILLLRSRSSALEVGVVDASDALVVTGGVLTLVLAVVAATATLWWLLVARAAAADESGQAQPRSAWQAVVAVLLPGPNLVLAGSVVSELEHAVLHRDRDERPKPSRLVRCWWAAWVANGVLLVVSVVWRLRSGVQAQADSVVLTAVNDLAAAALALLTVLVVRRVTDLLEPANPARLAGMRVLKVADAPAPALRPARPATAPR
ncbi:DUF4328 domain-containing protein [Amycolatopsis suaedae]|uniref:DUF4328 domain-containing protein n=1 Tax=Amycolatopsis suaedae TaxID=2510978 RepID=A0A4Q7J4Y3_9PSEU|nr:DUF4328 domain-containing protein [Amycolatopsis suaedae]RZQ62119.1 DUF4328 domain-containing protein [Amycolatopsis suaedae]